MRARIPSMVLVATMAWLASPSLARADDDVAKAQALFVEGRKAMEKGDFAGACAKFTQSLALAHRAGTLVNLAQCEEGQGKLSSAAEHWKEGIDLLPAGDERLAPSKQRAAALARRTPRLSARLAGPAPEGARVELDGKSLRLDQTAAGVPVDPGQHAVVFIVPGSAPQRLTVDLAEGENKVIALSLPTAAPVAPPPAPATPTGGGGMRTAGFALLGVGAAGAILAGITGGMLVSRNAAINAACPVVGSTRECTTHGRDLINGVGPLNVANAIGWGLGIAGVGVGAVLVAVGGKNVAVSPTALPGGAGALVTHRF